LSRLGWTAPRPQHGCQRPEVLAREDSSQGQLPECVPQRPRTQSSASLDVSEKRGALGPQVGGHVARWPWRQGIRQVQEKETALPASDETHIRPAALTARSDPSVLSGLHQPVQVAPTIPWDAAGQHLSLPRQRG